MRLFRPADAPPWLPEYSRSIERDFARANVLPAYTVATVPSAAANPWAQIMVTNELGGAVPAFSDGTNWRRVTDRAVIS